MNNKYLIVEGGGFKTGFTAGILDAFIMSSYRPFDNFIGISGGSIALSYFLSAQYRFCISAIKLLAKDQNFMDFKRTFGNRGYMDIDYIAQVAGEKVPFDLEKGVKAADRFFVRFVATNMNTGSPYYVSPNKENWVDAVIASSTLPFVTKGKHLLNGVEYFDGGWSDPLPVRWAYEQGAREILVLRTWPSDARSSQSWTDYFGSIYFNSSPGLKKTFDSCHLIYNDSLDFIANPPKDLIIRQIAPKKLLKSGTYSYTNKTIMSDYRYGLDKGLNFVNEMRQP